MTSLNNLSCLIESSKVINSSLNLTNILTKVTKISKDILEAEAGSLMLLDKNTNELTFTVALGKKGHKLAKNIRMRLGEGIVGNVAKTGKPIIVKDAYKDKRFSSIGDKISGFKTRSIMCVPLHADNKIIGVMEAINSHHTGGFTKKDLNLFQAFACQVAVAIENARLHKEELEMQKLNQELAIARMIQQNLLPNVPKIPDIQIYAKNIPAEQVGGDLYDFINLGDGKIGIMISDVSGKGIPAALCMVRVMSEFRPIAKTEEDLGNVLTKINKIFSDNSIMGMFVTLFYLVIDKKNMKISYISAGHPPALYYMDKIRYLDKAQNPPLGIKPGLKYKYSSIDFTNGARILYYKGLWQIERGFRSLKTELETAPIYHWTESRIRSHIYICFLALVMRIGLEKRIKAIDPNLSFSDVMRDVGRIKASKLKINDEEFIIRTDLTGDANVAFKAVNMRVPSKIIFSSSNHS